MNRLKLLREENGMTQQNVADRLNIAKCTVATYENGTRNLTMKVLLKFAKLYNCSTDYILGKSDSRQNNDDPLGLLSIGFDLKDYSPLTESQKQQLKDIIKIMFKDNKK